MPNESKWTSVGILAGAGAALLLLDALYASTAHAAPPPLSGPMPLPGSPAPLPLPGTPAPLPLPQMPPAQPEPIPPAPPMTGYALAPGDVLAFTIDRPLAQFLGTEQYTPQDQLVSEEILRVLNMLGYDATMGRSNAEVGVQNRAWKTGRVTASRASQTQLVGPEFGEGITLVAVHDDMEQPKMPITSR